MPPAVLLAVCGVFVMIVVSAHGRITGWLLGFLPPALALILFVISPQHMRRLLDDPLGVQMLVAAILLQVVGVLIIRRIVDVEN